MQFDRMVGNVRVLNAGSVGMPFGQTGAHWLLIESDVNFQRTRYDLAEASNRIRATALGCHRAIASLIAHLLCTLAHGAPVWASEFFGSAKVFA